MLAKLADELPAGRRLPLRAEVGRLPRDRLSRRRRRLHPEPRPAAARSLLSRAARRAARAACPTAAWSTARSSSRRRDGLDFDALQLRLHPAASRVAKLAQETPASFVAFDLLAVGRPATCAQRRSASAARGSSGCSRGVEPPVHLTPMTRDRARGRRLARRVRRRRPRRRDRQAARRRLPARQARDDQDQARAHRRLRRRRLPLAQERRDGWSARCCSASTTTRARCTTSASPRRSRWRCARQLRDGAGAAARATRSTTIRGASGPSAERAASARACPAGRAAGAPARICRGSRCASSASAR